MAPGERCDVPGGQHSGPSWPKEGAPLPGWGGCPAAQDRAESRTQMNCSVRSERGRAGRVRCEPGRSRSSGRSGRLRHMTGEPENLGAAGVPGPGNAKAPGLPLLLQMGYKGFPPHLTTPQPALGAAETTYRMPSWGVGGTDSGPDPALGSWDLI